MKVVIVKPKKPYEKWLKPLAVIFLLIVAFVVLKPEIEVEEHPVVEEKYEPVDVTREKSEVFLNGFVNTAGNISWSDDQIFTFYGENDKKGNGIFEMDLSELSYDRIDETELEKEPITLENKSITHYKILYQMSDRRLYYINSSDVYGIYTLDDNGNYLKITDKMACEADDNPLIILSENGNKMLYLEASTDKLVTYDFTTKKKKIINQVIDEQSFYTALILAPNGGYIILKNQSDIPTFSCWGSDSGKQYVDAVEGINPMFSSNDDYIYYLYNGNLTSTISGKRIGVIELGKMDIKYLTAVEEESYFSEYLLTEDNQLMYISGVPENDVFIVDKIMFYDPVNSQKKVIDGFAGLEVNHIELIGNLLLVPEDNNALKVLNLSNSTVQNYEGLTRMSENDLYQKIEDAFLLNYGNCIYMVGDEGKSLIYNYEGEYIASGVSPGHDKLAIVSKNSDRTLNFAVTYRLGIRY